jgi:hypothetical protein
VYISFVEHFWKGEYAENKMQLSDVIQLLTVSKLAMLSYGQVYRDLTLATESENVYTLLAFAG